MTKPYFRECKICSFECDNKKTWFNHRNSVSHKKRLSDEEHTTCVCEINSMNVANTNLKLELEAVKKQYDDIIFEKDKEMYKLKMDLELANFKLNFYEEQKQTTQQQQDPSGNIFNINISNSKASQSARDTTPQEPSVDEALDLSIIDLSLNEMIEHEYTPTHAFQQEILKLDKDQRPIQFWKKELYVKNGGVWHKGKDAIKALNRHSAELFQSLNADLLNNRCETETEHYNYMMASRLILDDFTCETIIKGMKSKL